MKAFTAGTLTGIAFGLFISLAKDDHGETIKDKLLSEGQEVGSDLADLGRSLANAQEAAGRLQNSLSQFSQNRQD